MSRALWWLLTRLAAGFLIGVALAMHTEHQLTAGLLLMAAVVALIEGERRQVVDDVVVLRGDGAYVVESEIPLTGEEAAVIKERFARQGITSVVVLCPPFRIARRSR